MMNVGGVGVVLWETLCLYHKLTSPAHHHGAEIVLPHVIGHPEFGGALNQTHAAITTITGRWLTFQSAIRNFISICSRKNPSERGS